MSKHGIIDLSINYHCVYQRTYKPDIEHTDVFLSSVASHRGVTSLCDLELDLTMTFRDHNLTFTGHKFLSVPIL